MTMALPQPISLAAQTPYPGGHHAERRLDYHVREMGGKSSRPLGIEHWFDDLEDLSAFTGLGFSGKGVPDRVIRFPQHGLMFAAFVRGQRGCYPGRLAFNFTASADEIAAMADWTRLTRMPSMFVFVSWTDNCFVASPGEITQSGDPGLAESGKLIYWVNAMTERMTPLDNLAKYGLLPFPSSLPAAA